MFFCAGRSTGWSRVYNTRPDKGKPGNGGVFADFAGFVDPAGLLD